MVDGIKQAYTQKQVGKTGSTNRYSTSSATSDAIFNKQNKTERAKFEAKLKELGLTDYNGAGSDVKAHYANNPQKPVPLKKIGNAQNGRSICQDASGNILVVAHDGTILKSDYVKNPEKYEQAKRNQEIIKRNKTQKAAEDFYKIADNNSGLNSIRKMQQHLDKNVNADNIMDFLDDYDKYKQDDTSIIDTITGEIGASGHVEQKKLLFSVMEKLSEAARKTGVSEGDIKKANDDFLSSYNIEYRSMSGAFRKTNPKDMGKALDSLRGAILAKQNGGVEISTSDAIKEYKSLAMEEHNGVAKSFNQARRDEGWAAKSGDTILGWFGCNTIEDLTAKFNNNKEFVQALINSKSEAEFCEIFKNGLTTPDGRKIPGRGVDFDPNKIAAREKAVEKYALASNLDNTAKTVDKLLKHDRWGYNDLKTAIRNNFKYDNETIDQIVNAYAQEKGIKDPKQALVQFLNDTKSAAGSEFANISNGKSLTQMANNVELITKSALGEDITKDNDQFNANQEITGMVTEAGAEILGTVALQFVPGLGQVAATRLALTASRWGAKGVKLANWAVKAETTFAKAKRVTTATQTAQAATNIASTGVATTAVDLSNGKSVKEATQKALMNMSFAGVGASSSVLAPKLMQTFGIADKAIANEIAEEIINAAGSYGITALQGGEYGSTDAFIDFASGLIISRLSHVKGASKSNIPADAEGNPLAGGLFGKKDGGGFFSKIADKFDPRTDYEKAADARSALKNQQAVDNGLDQAIAQGKVSSEVREIMSRKGSNYSTNDATLGFSASDRLVKALDMDRKGKSFVKTIRSDADISNISRYVADGEVCSVGGRLYVNDNGNAIPINMSKQKFEELFPPLKCAAMQQDSGTHICVATSQINSMLETPGGRARLFSMLEEGADGSITVNLSNGGRPVKFPSGKPIRLQSKFMTNAPDGIQMIEQAFMADNIKPSSVDNVTDISTISRDELANQAIGVLNRRTTNDTAARIGGTNQTKYYNTYDRKTHTIKDNIREKFDDILNDFVPGQDVLIVHWDGHERSIVDYDKVNQIVTYRDPMSPGVDTQCTFLQLMHKGSHSKDGYGMYLSLQKRTPIKTKETPNVTPQPQKSTESDFQNTAATHQTSQFKFEERTSNLNSKQFVPVAKTAEGNDIFAKVSPDDGSITISKNGKETNFQLDRGDFEIINESSTDTYLIVKKDHNGNVTVKTSETGEISDAEYEELASKPQPESPQNTGATQEPATPPKRRYVIGEETATNTATTPKQKPQLEIPHGAKLVDTVKLFGKTCRRIQMPNGEYLTEWNNQWKKL